MLPMESVVAEMDDRDILLDTWRCISVLCVIVSHALRFKFNLDLRSNGFLWSLGVLGVHFFFVISGYIITRRLIAEKSLRGAVSLRAFFVRRAARILPALWLYFAFVYLMDSMRLIDGPQTWWRAVFFLCNTDVCSVPLIHTWSLSVEEQYYVIWPLVVALMPLRRLPLIALGVIGLLALAFQAHLLRTVLADNATAFGCIGAGALYASSPKVQKLVLNISVRPMFVLLGVLLLAKGALPQIFPAQDRLYDIGYPLLVALTIFSTFRFRPVVSRWWVCRKVLAPIGVVSYGLYLWHQPFVGTDYASAFLDFWPNFIFLAVGSYLVVERPINRWARAWSAKVRPQRAVSAAA
jgi:peptidoglycan/LPS O-acetylase OafA/YrhL